MNELDIQIAGWFGTKEQDALDATLAAIRIEAGIPPRIPITEVHDKATCSVRDHIYVSAYALARWLLLNWWRLRWEPLRSTPDWAWAHRLAAIGEGMVWPPLSISSDGQYIRLHQEAEEGADAATIRFLRPVDLEVSARQFEAAADQFVDVVIQHLADLQHPDQDLRLLRDELAQERADLERSRMYRRLALAGLPVEALTGRWMKAVGSLERDTGEAALDEVLAILPEWDGDLSAAGKAVEAIENIGVDARLPHPQSKAIDWSKEWPWQAGERLALVFRQTIHRGSGAISDRELGESLDLDLSTLDAKATPSSPLAGGLRPKKHSEPTRIAIPKRRRTGQRFYLARLIACAHLLPQSERLLPVTEAGTALQKFQRAFGQELLCPWNELEPFTEENGCDEDGLALAAEHFQVSDLLVRTTLVNRHKLSRHRLEMD